MRKGSRLKRFLVYDQWYDCLEVWKVYLKDEHTFDYEPGKNTNGYVHYGKVVIGRF